MLLLVCLLAVAPGVVGILVGTVLLPRVLGAYRAASLAGVASILGGVLALGCMLRDESFLSLAINPIPAFSEASVPHSLGAAIVSWGGLYLDRVTAVMLLVVGIIAYVVIHFSKRYLGGDPRQVYFLRWLLITTGCVQLVLLAGSLPFFFVAWVAVSFSLHRLLTFYSDRPLAVACARKKFVVSRVGDLAIIAAIALSAFIFKSLEFSQLSTVYVAQVAAASPSAVHIIGLLFAIGALTKSAQIPFHSWLPDSLETPTPVSALMHAGIINAGGYLLIRVSPILEHSPMAMALLALVGGATALLGMSVMVTQTSIKKRLAYSTVGQMGFMIMQCGLGLWALALLHIVAHAFYKAYAFLRAGSAMDQAQEQIYFPARSLPSLALSRRLLSGLALVLVLVAGLTLSLSRTLGVSLNYLPVLFVWLIVSIHITIGTARVSEQRLLSVGPALLVFVSLFVSYAGLSSLFRWYLSPVVSAMPEAQLPVVALLLLGFIATFVLQLFPEIISSSERGQRFFIHLHSGFYLGTYLDQVIKRLWNTPAHRRVSSSRNSL